MKTYRRISGRAAHLAGHTQVWMGDDHLLLVSSSGMIEEYKRFYFAEIQAVHVVKTHRYLINNVLSGSLLILVLILTLELSGTAHTVVLLLGLAPLIALLHNLYAGSGCSCHLRTAVQTCRLPPIRRARQARKLMEAIRPAIAAAQPVIPREQLVSAAVGVPLSVAQGVTGNPVEAA